MSVKRDNEAIAKLYMEDMGVERSFDEFQGNTEQEALNLEGERCGAAISREEVAEILSRADSWTEDQFVYGPGTGMTDEIFSSLQRACTWDDVREAADDFATSYADQDGGEWKYWDDFADGIYGDFRFTIETNKEKTNPGYKSQWLATPPHQRK